MPLVPNPPAPFVGGPLDGRIAPSSRAMYRSAETAEPLPTQVGDRWLIGKQSQYNNPKVIQKLRSFYTRRQHGWDNETDPRNPRAIVTYQWAFDAAFEDRLLNRHNGFPLIRKYDLIGLRLANGETTIGIVDDWWNYQHRPDWDAIVIRPLKPGTQEPARSGRLMIPWPDVADYEVVFYRTGALDAGGQWQVDLSPLERLLQPA